MYQQVCLYIATHNTTGLKYFGKTTKYFNQKDLQKYYHGSGKYWLDHLKKYDDNVTMKVYGIYNINNVKNEALKFSEDNNIVKVLNENGKKVWANEKPENGLDGWISGESHSIQTKEKMSLYQANRKIHPAKDLIHSNKTIAQMSSSALNRKTVKCPYCKKEGKINGMKQWHFEYCQENPDRLIHEVRPKQIIVECPHCKKTGQKSAMLRWHFDKCKFFTLSNNS